MGFFANCSVQTFSLAKVHLLTWRKGQSGLTKYRKRALIWTISTSENLLPWRNWRCMVFSKNKADKVQLLEIFQVSISVSVSQNMRKNQLGLPKGPTWTIHGSENKLALEKLILQCGKKTISKLVSPDWVITEGSMGVLNTTTQKKIQNHHITVKISCKHYASPPKIAVNIALPQEML